MIKMIIKGSGLLLVIAYILLNLTQINGMMVPIKTLPMESPAEKALSKIGIKSDKLAVSYDMVSRKMGISQEMLIALTYTESNFNPNAVSSKGYRGLMQIPVHLTSQDAHIFEGANIFKDKLRITNGNVRRAIALYKGYGNHSKGLQQADKVLLLYNRLKTEV